MSCQCGDPGCVLPPANPLDGTTGDARLGVRFAITAPDHATLLAAFHYVLARAGSGISAPTVDRTPGRERITYPDGGSIRFTTDPRGLDVDVLIPLEGNR